MTHSNDTLHERLPLLERYHDGEVSDAEAAEIEAMLATGGPAFDYLGQLDDLGELLREADQDALADVSFAGLWDGISADIQADRDAAAKVAAAAKAAADAPETFGQRLGRWFHELFIENKSAWIAAGAAAAAVALVMSFQDTNAPPASLPATPGAGGGIASGTPTPGGFSNASGNGASPIVPASHDTAPAPAHGTRKVVKKVIEKHYIYVDSVDQADPNSTIVVNSLKDEDTAVIWLLPEDNAKGKDDTAAPATPDGKTEGVDIQEEPL